MRANVVGAYEAFVRDQKQVAFYDPGVGTFDVLGRTLGKKGVISLALDLAGACKRIWEFRVLSGSGRGSQVRLIGRFAPATPRFYRFPAGMDSSPSAQVQLLP